MAGPARAWTGLDAHASLVLGRSWHGAAVADLVPVRRRASGGSAVLRGPWMLRAAVRLPPGHALLRHGPVGAARWFGQVHLQWLLCSGVAGAALDDGPCTDHWSCFSGRGPGEVLVQGRKITGIAQAWQRHGVLLASGTLLAQPPWPVLCAMLYRPASEARCLEAATTDATEQLGHSPDAVAWAADLRARLQAALVSR